MAKTLYSVIMAGRNINGSVDGIETDMPSYRVRIIFKDNEGVIVHGDICMCGRHFTYGHENVKKSSHLYISTDFCVETTMKGKHWDGEVDMPISTRYKKDYEVCKEKPYYFSQSGVLALLNRLTGLDYDRIEFMDKYADWEKQPDVAALLKEEKENEEKAYAVYHKQCEVIDKRRQELSDKVHAKMMERIMAKEVA